MDRLRGGVVARGFGACCAALALSACATGGGSLIAGSGGQGASDALAEDIAFETAAPDIVAASGTALLPGSRSAASAPLLGQPGNQGIAAAGLRDANSPLLTGSLTTSGLIRGPLLGLNSGGRSLLLGVSADANVLGRVGAGVSVTPTVATTTVSPTTAATGLLVSLGGQIRTTLPPTAGASPTSPMTPPTLGVPGATPLAALTPLLTAIRGGLLGR